MKDSLRALSGRMVVALALGYMTPVVGCGAEGG